jgi:hypothetical protein
VVTQAQPVVITGPREILRLSPTLISAKVWVFVGDKIYEMTPDLLRSLDIEDSKKR